MLVDRNSFPRAKVCGCCLAPTGRRILRDLELDEITRPGIPLQTAVIQSSGCRQRLDFESHLAHGLDLGVVNGSCVARGRGHGSLRRGALRALRRLPVRRGLHRAAR